MEKEYSALDIATYFIKKATKESDVKLTPLKLQKLLYYAQGWYLANLNKPLFKDKIEAWKYGPAIPSIYHQFKGYGSESLCSKGIDTSAADKIETDKTIKSFLDEVWNVYKPYDGSDLIYSTHKEDPWIEAKDGIKTDDHFDFTISNDSIKTFFQKRLKNG